MNSENLVIHNHISRKQMSREYIRGVPVSEIARKYSVSDSALRNYLKKHLSNQLVRAEKNRDVGEGIDLLHEVDDLIIKVKIIFDRNFEDKKDFVALKALSENRAVLELFCKISTAMHQAAILENENTDEFKNMAREDKIEKFQSVLTEYERDLLFQLNSKMLARDKNIEIKVPFILKKTRTYKKNVILKETEQDVIQEKAEKKQALKIKRKEESLQYRDISEMENISEME